MRSYKWQISDSEFEAYHRRLRFQFQKWDGYVDGRLRLCPESLVLTRDEHLEIVTMAESMAAGLRVMERELRSRQDWLTRLGIPVAVQRLIEREKESAWQLARYDFTRTPDGRWQVCEFNEDVPGGFNEIVGARQLLTPYHSGLTFVDRFAEALLDAIPRAGRIALMYATGYAEDLQHMVVLQKLLRERGQEAVLCSPRHLTRGWRGFTIDGESVTAGIRFYPGEWFGLLENRRVWNSAVRAWPMLNPLTRLISQSKAVFSVWKGDEFKDFIDLGFWRRLTPETFGGLEGLGNQDVWRDLAENRAGWVCKQHFGRMGDTVVMGKLSTAEQWQRTLQELQKKPQDWVMQRCFEVAPVEFSSGPLYPAVGAYLINGRFVGYYSRVAAEPFLTHQAVYVPTVIDD